MVWAYELGKVLPIGGEVETMKDVVIYPSSWYYNACVQGFLEVLAYGLGEQIVTDEFLQNDGTVKIPGDLMEAVFAAKTRPCQILL